MGCDSCGCDVKGHSKWMTSYLSCSILYCTVRKRENRHHDVLCCCCHQQSGDSSAPVSIHRQNADGAPPPPYATASPSMRPDVISDTQSDLNLRSARYVQCTSTEASTQTCVYMHKPANAIELRYNAI